MAKKSSAKVVKTAKKDSKPAKKSKLKTKSLLGRSKTRTKKTVTDYEVMPLRYILLEVFSLFKQNWRRIGLFTLLYGAFYFILVRALTEYDVNQLRETLSNLTGANEAEISNSLILTGVVFGLSLELNESSSMYAVILFVIFSLAYLWILRHIWIGRKTTIKSAFYEGMGPLVPFIIVLMIIALELIPLSIGSFVVGIAHTNELLVNWWEFLMVYGFFILMLVLSGYLMVGGIMASYITTIPAITPREALKSARKLLKGRRFIVLQRVILLLIISFALAFGVLLAVVLVVQEAALVAVTLLSVAALPWFHTCFYALYRSLIDESD